MGWRVIVALIGAAPVAPDWATVHRLFDTPAFVLPPGGVSGGLAMSWQGQFGSPYYALGRARVDVGLPSRFEVGLSAEALALPFRNPLAAWGSSARASVRWAPLEWGEWPVNPTVGLVVFATPQGKLLVGPRAGISGTLVASRWRWALESSLVLRGQTPSAWDYLISSCWQAELHAQTSFQLLGPLSTGLYAALRRAGPSPDRGKDWTTTLYATTDAHLELGAFLQFALGPVTLQASVGFRRNEIMEDSPGVTILSDTASLTFAITAARDPRLAGPVLADAAVAPVDVGRVP